MMKYTEKSGKCVRLAVAVCFLIGAAVAEDKWVWSGDRRSGDRQDRKYSSASGSNSNGRFDGIRERYDVTEPTTRRPDASRPQADEFSEDFDSGNPRFNFNAFGRPGLPPSGFGPIGPQDNIYPNPQNGILVGPGGPTGIIGRPPHGGPPISRPPFNPLKGHPANGVLVGPGGPTGIIGRPPNYPASGINNNLGPQVFPTVPGSQGNPPPLYPQPIPPLGPGPFPGPGPLPGPGAYPTGIFPGGGIPPNIGAYPGGYPNSPGLPGQGLFPGRDQNYYLSNYGPFRSRSSSQAYEDYDERSVGGKLRDSEKTVNRNILKKSVR